MKLKERIPETDHGITGIDTVETYDKMMKTHRDRGWLGIDSMIKYGFNNGHALEIGPGPGYLGLEWLANTSDTRLTGLDISDDMIKLAKKNASSYNMNHNRTEYCKGNAASMPLPDNTFDYAFSNGSLHEWEFPERVFNEIYRVLKPGGKFHITDLRRDISFIVRFFMKASIKPKEMAPFFITSLQAAYTEKEIRNVLTGTGFENYEIKKDLFGLTITGTK